MKVNHDMRCKVECAAQSEALVSWFLIASYAYYQHDVSLISDGVYDDLAKKILAKWAKLKHPHLTFITKEDLRAGTGYMLTEERTPNIVKGNAARLAAEIGHFIEWRMTDFKYDSNGYAVPPAPVLDDDDDDDLLSLDDDDDDLLAL